MTTETLFFKLSENWSSEEIIEAIDLNIFKLGASNIRQAVLMDDITKGIKEIIRTKAL